MSLEIDPKVNLGHILIMIGMLGSGISAYVAAKVTLNEHANKLEILDTVQKSIQSQQTKQDLRTDDMNNSLWNMKQDIAVIRQRIEYMSNGPMTKQR